MFIQFDIVLMGALLHPYFGFFTVFDVLLSQLVLHMYDMQVVCVRASIVHLHRYGTANNSFEGVSMDSFSLDFLRSFPETM